MDWKRGTEKKGEREWKRGRRKRERGRRDTVREGHEKGDNEINEKKKRKWEGAVLKLGCLDSRTVPTARARMTSPICTGGT